VATVILPTRRDTEGATGQTMPPAAEWIVSKSSSC